MKYKVVGWLDIVFGMIGALQQSIMLFVVYPKMNNLYQDFSGELPVQTKMFPYLTGLGIILFAGIAFLGMKLAFSKTSHEKLFKWGVGVLVGMLALGGIGIGFSIFSVIMPLYSITSGI
jgi:hypothetical protein